MLFRIEKNPSNSFKNSLAIHQPNERKASNNPLAFSPLISKNCTILPSSYE